MTVWVLMLIICSGPTENDCSPHAMLFASQPECAAGMIEVDRLLTERLLIGRGRCQEMPAPKVSRPELRS